MRPATRAAIEGYIGISPWLIGFLLFTLGPLVASLVLSFSDWQITIAPTWVGLDNYVRIFTKDPDFYQSLKVTFSFIALFNIVGRLLSCTLVAYSFARLRFPGRNLLFMLLLSTLMIPGQVTLLPQFVLFNWLGWVGSYLPLIVPSFFGNAFFIFLMRQYIMTIPRDLDEAARIDGASTWGRHRRRCWPRP